MTNPAIEDRYTAAVENYHAAAAALSAATAARAFAQAVDFFPTTVTLHVEGEVGEEGNIIIRAQKVTDADGNTIAGYEDGGMSDDEKWDAFTDVVDPDLDWLGVLNGDDWFGEQEITEPAPVPAPEYYHWCDECLFPIPNETSKVNTFHGPACSLHGDLS